MHDSIGRERGFINFCLDCPIKELELDIGSTDFILRSQVSSDLSRVCGLEADITRNTALGNTVEARVMENALKVYSPEAIERIRSRLDSVDPITFANGTLEAINSCLIAFIDGTCQLQKFRQ